MDLAHYTEIVAAKLTPEQKERILHRAAELEITPGEYARRVLLASLDASADCRLLLAEQFRSSHFIESLLMAWLHETPISEELLASFKSDSERRKGRLAEAAIARARQETWGFASHLAEE